MSKNDRENTVRYGKRDRGRRGLRVEGNSLCASARAFYAARPAQPWKDVRSAEEYGASCPQENREKRRNG